MIRKPIGRIPRILLGIISFCVLIGAYTLLANIQYSRNPTQHTAPGWTKHQQIRIVDKKLTEAQSRLQKAEAAQDEKAIEVASADVSRLEYAKQQINDAPKSMLSGLKRILFGDSNGDSGLSERLREGWLYQDFGATMKRFALGMLLGISLAFVTGIAMGCFTPVEALLQPPLAFLASIPPNAMMAVYMMIFSLEPFVGIIGFGIFPVLAQAIYQAVKHDVPESSVSKAYTLGASNFEVIWEVVIPQIMPRIIDAIRLQIGPAMIFLIAAEMIVGSEAGLGYRIRMSPKSGEYNVIYLYLIVLGAFGMLVDWGMIGFRRWWCPWFGGDR